MDPTAELPIDDDPANSAIPRLTVRHRLAWCAAIALLVGLVSCSVSIALAPPGSQGAGHGTLFQVLALVTVVAAATGLLSSLAGLVLTRLRGGVFYALLLAAAVFLLRLVLDR